MKVAMVCLDPTYESTARFMADAINEYTPAKVNTFVTMDTIHQKFQDIDFWYIWNGINASVDGFENIQQQMRLNSASGKCFFCNEPIQDFVKFRVYQQPCPNCGKRPVLSSNFIYIFSGNTLRRQADMFFKAQLAVRYWASVDADWTLFRCLVQSVTMIPHIMAMPVSTNRNHTTPYTISHFPTPDEPVEDPVFQKVRDLCQQRGLRFNNDPACLGETNIYIDQLFTGVPSQYAINAMASGIPVIANVSKFYLSHYLDFPAIISEPESVCQYIEALVDAKGIDTTPAQKFVMKWFNPERVAQQWYHLARFILDPALYIDKQFRESDPPKPLPAYWALQGGFELKQ